MKEDKDICKSIRENDKEQLKSYMNDPDIVWTSEHLRYAAENKNDTLVHFLLQQNSVNPLDDESLALRWACEKKNNLKIIQLLIPVSCVKDAESAACRLAIMHGDLEAARLLLPLSNIVDIEKNLLKRQKHFYHNKNALHDFQILKEEYQNIQFKKNMLKSLKNHQTQDVPHNHKKI